MIEVSYDGAYPNTCSGTLIIKVDGKEVYHDCACCHSTGEVWFDDEWGDHVEDGELEWNADEASKFSKEIQDAVRDKLSEFQVCCGGCV